MPQLLLTSQFPVKQQQGSMLLMTMVMLMMFVLAGLYVMEMAMLEEVTVSNEQRSQQVYQTAFDELEAQLDSLVTAPAILNNAITADQTLTPITNPAGCTTPRAVCQEVTLSYIGQSPPPAGYTLGEYTGLTYEINSIATITEVSARSDQTLSLTYVVRRP